MEVYLSRNEHDKLYYDITYTTAFCTTLVAVIFCDYLDDLGCEDVRERLDKLPKGTKLRITFSVKEAHDDSE